jgi:hypothetical protein
MKENSMQEAQQEVQKRRISFDGQTLTVQVLNPESAQDWTNDPYMVEVYLNLPTLSRVARTLRIVKQEDLDEARIDIGVSYEVFDLAENQEIDPEDPQKTSEGPDGKSYVAFETQYRLVNAILSVRQSGYLAVKIMLKDNRDYLYASLGSIDELLELAKTAVPPDTYRFVDQVASLSIWSYDKDDGTPHQECDEPADG